MQRVGRKTSQAHVSLADLGGDLQNIHMAIIDMNCGNTFLTTTSSRTVLRLSHRGQASHMKRSNKCDTIHIGQMCHSQENVHVYLHVRVYHTTLEQSRQKQEGTVQQTKELDEDFCTPPWNTES